MKKLRGKITMGRYSGSREGFHIEIEDDRSGLPCIEVDMTLAQFAEAITGMGCVPCKIEFNDSGLIGKYREGKSVEVFVPDGPWESRDERARVAVAEHEVDGWEGRTGDALNTHNWIPSTRVEENNPDGKTPGIASRVHFTRWVNKKPEGKP